MKNRLCDSDNDPLGEVYHPQASTIHHQGVYAIYNPYIKSED